ncbi:replication protein P [Haemophilus parahaemolyticus]|uniref:replication protein P n=1 Tax=Haemophilus parahaemolyticus TaxID=735 RepID=UPI00249393C6|nr:replication protein P [Haemophilus parahaemolyticus]
MSLLAVQPQAEKQLPAEFVERAESEVNRIFNVLKGSHLGWRANIKTQAEYDNARREWLRLLLKHRLTATEIEQGLAVAEMDKSPYLPSFGQFYDWCKTVNYESLGLPSLEQLLKRLNHFAAYGFEDADKFSFKNDAEYWLITDLYRRERRYLWQESTLRSQAEQALLKMAKRIQAGENIPERAKAIEKPKEYIPAHPLVEARLRELREQGEQNAI